MGENSSGTDLSDSEIVKRCEEQLIEMEVEDVGIGKRADGIARSVEKRKEREDDSSEDGFITVNRRKPKRLIRSDSTDTRNGNGTEKNGEKVTNTHEVCITSQNELPKPIAMAKLLSSENMKNILRIKYKSSFKAMIQFKIIEDAEKLLNCQKIKDMGLRCQLTQEMTTCYGIVKGIDLELNEDEIKNILKSNTEVLSIKRLQRLNSEGKWIDCESIRISFKGDVLPQYVYAYDCRFIVEAYTFPVTQCSGCWKFGHLIKYCPAKKICCPKCGGNHDNCSLEEYKCLNCKGDHFVLDRKCPMYIKEKTIRKIMSEEQITYRNALQRYMDKKQEMNKDTMDTSYITNTQSIIPPNPATETYSSVLTRALVHQELHENKNKQEELRQTEKPAAIINKKVTSKQVTTKNTNKTYNNKNDDIFELRVDEECSTSQRIEEGTKRSEQLLCKFEWKKIWEKIKSIIRSESKFEEKIISLFKIVCEELKNFVIKLILGEEILNNINCFSNG
ncbi:hypothetical protein SFRURICE_020886 [Spodoptera frugiperda]|nr:hypothetical protein SFRURICE_020886 [Spodoptera frugiperda]